MASLRGGVCGADVLPMLGGKVVKCQESHPVFFQAGDSFFVFDLVFYTEGGCSEFRVTGSA